MILNPVDGEREKYLHVYDGKFKDRNPDVHTAGILTFASGHNFSDSLKQPSALNSTSIPETVEKFRSYTDPKLGTTRTHYGRYNDYPVYNNLTHGLIIDDSDNTAKNLANPPLYTQFEQRKINSSERIYKSNQVKPLGKVPVFNLPDAIDPYAHTFGRLTTKNYNAREVINPDKSRVQVELETSDKHDMYVHSHADYEPGEQKNRRYFEPYSNNDRYGKTTPVYHDGRLVKQTLNWLPQKLLETRAEVDSSLLDKFREKHTHQLGKPLDPNKDTRLVGPDHTFGVTNTAEPFGAADVINGRSYENTLKGKDKERAYLSSLRSHLARHNYTVFKTLVAAFKFYDQDKDGLISRDELRVACFKTGFPVADDLLDALIYECDADRDGFINFLEFSNFLCFKESMKTGLSYDPNDAHVLKAKEEHPNNEYLVCDADDQRPLIKDTDLQHKNNIEVNELIPRTVVHQLDTKIGNWRTTYDVINEAPFRPQPEVKRVYGVPSIRNDLIAPRERKIVDRKNYGNDGNAWQLLQPSIFTTYGIHERDIFEPRSREEIRTIFTNIGVQLESDLFETMWKQASSLNPYGQVSVEEFRAALDQYNHNQQSLIE